MTTMKIVFAATGLLLIAACTGNSSGGPAGGGSDDGGGGASPRSLEEHFASNVEPRLAYCRKCHVPGGVGDVEDGHDFMLSKNAGEDYDNLKTSWERLGGNDPTSRILTMASGAETPHTGGAPWRVGSPSYQSMEVLLKCFADPGGCDALLATIGGGVVDELPLLGSQHGGHLWFSFCEGKPDSAVLPPDPRSLVVAGVNANKAVQYNTFWASCRDNPAAIGESGHPQTCGELRQQLALAEPLMRGNGAVGAGSFFAKDSPGDLFTVQAADLNNLWQLWGLPARPDNFDQLFAERYGTTIGSARNPYPLPGEDPNATNGGSGQLPAAFTQTHNADGSWSGKVGLTCHGCHSGAAGSAADGAGLGLLYGSGNSLNDTGLVARELGFGGRSPIAFFSLFGTSRGTNNASDVNVFFLVGQDNLLRLDAFTLGLLTSGSTGSGDTPSWWNLGHRPVKFQDGFFSNDDSRVDLIFYTPLQGDKPWVRAHALAADLWATALKSPVYPLPVDEALAEEGAILFHTKDLWASNLDNPVPRPKGGNGSCAGCHGAYSPRFSHDPSFLDDPALEGVAAYIAPKAIIGTDPARVDTNNEAVNQYGTGAFLAYSETTNTENDCGPRNRASIRGDREPGYLAQPLYGVWATAPYFHNGSVPDLWSVLQPSARPALWRRVSTPPRADQAGKVVMGFDTSLQRAYDPAHGGWRYETLACGAGTLPYLDCNPGNAGDPFLQIVQKLVYGNLLATWNLGNLPVWTQWTNQQIEDRKIYNTFLYSQGNEGHEFTSVLTDAERHALIEYLKTL